MYNFNLENDETVNSIFDDVLIKQGDNQKMVTVAITNKRILFLDYQNNELLDTLKGAHASSYIKCKEVFFFKDLSSIKSVTSQDFYQIEFDDNMVVEFDNKELFKALNK